MGGKNLLPALVLALSGMAASAAPQQPVLVIERVNVLPMTASENVPIRDATVVIADGRISSISRGRKGNPPPGSRRVDAKGKWLIPALTDAHVHIINERQVRLLMPEVSTGAISTADLLLPYVANGVLQVVNMSAMTESVAQRDEVESGKVLGPHIALAAMIDGSPPFWPPGMTRVATTAEAGKQAVREILAEGHDFIKTYSKLDLETFTAIVDEARERRMKVLGHLPGRGADRLEEFLQPGFSMVAHAEEFAHQSRSLSDEDVARFAQLARKSGVWLTATLALDERILTQVRDPQSLKRARELAYVHPALRKFWLEHNPYWKAPAAHFENLDKVIDFNKRLVKAFAWAGVPVVAGTDSSVPGVAPGFALHEELVAFTQAGLTNEQALSAATRLPAEWLGVAADRGTVETGKRANLVLLDADPLLDIAHTRKIFAVIANGRYLPRSELDATMAELAKRYAHSEP